MSFEGCRRPGQDKLANHGPITNVFGLLPKIAEHNEYWVKRASEATREGDAIRPLGETLSEILTKASAIFQIKAIAGETTPDQLKGPSFKQDWLQSMGALSVSAALREFPQNDVLYDDAKTMAPPVCLSAIGIDMLSGPDRMPLQPRLHLPENLATELLGEWPGATLRNVWYQHESGELYVNRVRPAQPTEKFNATMGKRGIIFNFSNTETIFPYIANQA